VEGSSGVDGWTEGGNYEREWVRTGAVQGSPHERGNPERDWAWPGAVVGWREWEEGKHERREGGA